MSKVYLPHADQFDLMNENLAKIANAIASDIDISTWSGIQKAVRMGVAPSLIPVGTQLTVSHSVYGDMLYDVVAHNHFKSARDENAHTMTLMCHDVIDATVQYDYREAFYCADTALPAGTYNFTIPSTYANLTAGTYYFELEDTLPAGGQLCMLDLTSGGGASTTDYTIYAFANATSDNTVAATGDIRLGSAGTSLGTFGEELNHAHRVVRGSNNYKESAIRQFLNSSAVAGSVWTPQTKFDRQPSWDSSVAGFMNGIDEELLAVIGEVIVPCSANDTYESPDSTTVKGGKYTVTDKFYLPSQAEIFGTQSSIVGDDSLLFPYYDGSTNADRIKYRSGVSTTWWLRSAHAQSGSVVRFVRADGSLHNDESIGSLCITPVCTIV